MPGSGAGSGKIRIINGRWKRRGLIIPPVPGLRPTPDRVRETLFNWLGNGIRGMRCLDLFAGSGALGLEAASRGAGEVVLVERGETAFRGLEAGVRALAEREGASGPAVSRKARAPKRAGPGKGISTPRGAERIFHFPYGLKITIIHADALSYLQGPPLPFQMVFLDPPFDSGLLETVCPRLVEGGWLGEGSGIYLENRRGSPGPVLPAGWEMTRDGTAGEVRFALWEN